MSGRRLFNSFVILFLKVKSNIKEKNFIAFLHCFSYCFKSYFIFLVSRLNKNITPIILLGSLEGSLES